MVFRLPILRMRRLRLACISRNFLAGAQQIRQQPVSARALTPETAGTARRQHRYKFPFRDARRVIRPVAGPALDRRSRSAPCNPHPSYREIRGRVPRTIHRKSAAVILFGHASSGFAGSSSFTGACSSTTRSGIRPMRHRQRGRKSAALVLDHQRSPALNKLFQPRLGRGQLRPRRVRADPDHDHIPLREVACRQLLPPSTGAA